VGAGSVIVGNISIGNNSKIGAGAIVYIDIPDNSTVVMEKPRILVKQIVI
jgi:serine acetyltransferase